MVAKGASNGYVLGIKTNTKSSITLPPEELKLVVALQAQLKAKSKVEVVRRGPKLLKESTDRASLRAAYRQASLATRASLGAELSELAHLAGDNLLRVPLPKGLGGNRQECEIMVDQSRATDNRRFVKALKPLPRPILRDVEDKLRRLAQL